ncbi:DUF7352 domain-containing protein [Paraglaciecola sp.]|uniref:DUF7352 domain-containing protein n=1 Tax=Paraglaciecola sp. TaxID=1920173 RepID=UPI003EF85FD1
MNKVIWKYTLTPAILIEIPKGAEILSVAEQNNEICLWALVDPNAELEAREFHVFGTGHNITIKGFDFIGTALLENGSLVFHVFEFK